MTRDELLASLLVERYDNTWWLRQSIPAGTEAAAKWDNSEVACAQRRRDLDREYQAAKVVA